MRVELRWVGDRRQEEHFPSVAWNGINISILADTAAECG